MSMPEMNRDGLLKTETVGTEQGWRSPLTQEDGEYFAYLRKVFAWLPWLKWKLRLPPHAGHLR